MISIGYIFILIYFAIIATVIEISVLLFRLTGLKKKISRFQTISMLTGTGFTTIESELILRHPVRRKLSAFLILFGAFSLAVIISTISSLLAIKFRILELSVVLLLLISLVFFLKLPWFQLTLRKKFAHHLKETLQPDELPIHEILYLDKDNDLFTNVDLYDKSAFLNKTPKEIFAENEDINLMFIKRGEVFIRTKRNETVLHEGDRLFLYGDKASIQRKFHYELKRHHAIHTEEQHVSSLL